LHGVLSGCLRDIALKIFLYYPYMYKSNFFFLLCALLLFSCTTKIESPPPPEPPGQEWSYCVYGDIKKCYSGSYTTCPGGGDLSDFCPYPDQSSNSLVEGVSSSSSVQGGQSSGSDAALEYEYCVFIADESCLTGPVSVCPPGGTLSHSCPYEGSSSSSINVAPSSSSNAPVPSSSSNTPSTPSIPSGSFNLTAIIYDTDISVHPDFSCGEYSLGVDYGNGASTKANCTLSSPYSSVDAYTAGGNKKGKCIGVRTGVVQSTLGADRKIRYNASGDKWQCWTNESWFDKAFNPTLGVNVQRCYDMPLTQQANGRFEFDSDKMLNANGYLVGGFHPYELTHRTGADYSQCPNCDARRPAESFAPLIKSISTDLFDSYVSREGDFSDGETPTAGAILGTSSTKSIWNWGDPMDGEPTRSDLKWYLHGSTAIKGSEMAPSNMLFCLENHSEFIYNPEQEFYIRGGDDIWVYIDNKLVVDLGGNHLAAPGHVILKDMTPALVSGEKYPIDIFFCNRRTTMSDLRISTNIPLIQTTKSCAN